MATQFDPIAKDQSMNTTESPSRNIADVLAQELSGISTALTTASNTKLHMFYKLWENPDPSVSFATQTITLASEDYDFLLIVARYKNNGPRIADSIILPKGVNGFISFADTVGTTATNIYRSINRNSDTSYTFTDAYLNGAVSNVMLIPTAIYGFKKSVDINAIVSSVSTDADKCMMSDGVTSVEQEITAVETDVTTLKKSNLQTRIAIDSYNSASNLYTFPCDGYVEMLPSDNTKTGVICVFGSQSNSASRCAHIESNGNHISLYVRKNMKCYCTGTANHYFIPIQ